MWVLVLISLYVLLVYLGLGTVWLILGAIVNPNAFLPYATAAATFVTAVTVKWSEFMSIAKNGLNTIMEFVSGKSETKINEMIKKIDL